jgi:hypothetical protein
MMNYLVRFSVLVGLTLLLFGLSGCEDKEAGQRKAFVDFLQTRILDKPGAHLPQLTGEETAQLGEYAKQYAIIQDFHKAIDATVNGQRNDAIGRGMVRSIRELISRRDDIEKARDTITQMGVTLETALSTADAAHAKLTQPGDLQPVYDKVYDRLVTSFGKAFRDEMMPVATASLADALKVSDYLMEHKTEIIFSGDNVQVKDENTKNELNKLLLQLNSHSQSMDKAKQSFSLATFGKAN